VSTRLWLQTKRGDYVLTTLQEVDEDKKIDARHVVEEAMSKQPSYERYNHIRHILCSECALAELSQMQQRRVLVTPV